MKKNIPNLRFPQFADAPEWEIKMLGEMCKFYSGGTPSTSKKEYFNGKIPFIRSGEIKDNKTAQFLTELGLKNSSAKMVSKGDILFALYGATSGEVAISKINGAINQAVLCIKSANNHYFIYSYLFFKKELIINVYLQGGQGNLSAEIVKSLLVPIPSLAEQTQIANFFAAVDNRILLLKQKYEQLKLYKKGIMQQIFSQKLRFKDENDEYFPDWEIKMLGEVGEIVTGKTPSTKNVELWNGTIPFVTPTDIKEQKYQNQTVRTVKKTAKIKLLPKGTVMFTCIASLGKMSLATKLCITNQQINSIVVNKIFNNEYVYYALLQQTDFIKSTQNGTTLPIINKTEFSKFLIPFPSLAEQEKIGEFLSLIDAQIENVGQQVEKTQLWKRGLLQKMMI